MMYDSIENLGRYRFVSPNLRAIEEHIHAGRPLGGAFSHSGERAAIREYDGRLCVNREQLCLHRVTAGREVVVTGYSEQARGLQYDDRGRAVIEGGQISTVVVLDTGDFILIMAGEPYAFALSGSSMDHESESIWFV